MIIGSDRIRFWHRENVIDVSEGSDHFLAVPKEIRHRIRYGDLCEEEARSLLHAYWEVAAALNQEEWDKLLDKEAVTIVCSCGVPGEKRYPERRVICSRFLLKEFLSKTLKRKGRFVRLLVDGYAPPPLDLARQKLMKFF